MKPIVDLSEMKILDACCGGRRMWFNKRHAATLYIDNRVLKKGEHKPRPNFKIDPDIVMDFTDLNLPDNHFKLVVFDPPHMFRTGKKSWLNQKYGTLKKHNWKKTMRRGFAECWRVLAPGGILIFKWSQNQISVKEVLKLIVARPLFGHPTGKCGSTKWMCFMKDDN